MYKIIINNEIELLGLVSFNIVNDNGEYIKEGMLKTHRYIEEIEMIECERFILTGVNVIAESFGSVDPFIVYNFTFNDYDVAYNHIEYSTEELIEMYEKESK